MGAEPRHWALCLGPVDRVDALLDSLPGRSTWPAGLELRRDLAPGAPFMVLLIEPAPVPWRDELDRRSWPYAVLQADDVRLIDVADSVIQHAWARVSQTDEARHTPRWRWVCADCDDGDCERHWLAAAGRPVDSAPG